ncbi:MAG: hypothetical protein CVU87_08980 [Firmicutes bacterium HGW-Firmicutes-12]|jgi:hypothetical protein|nr:MAG: hypothetical protein CVU87_08980 [Firmicutes bacterium HGW-Firmicutes-12]
MSQYNKGLVMETSLNGYITVMTTQGEFLKIPWSQKSLPNVGNEVEFVHAATKAGFFQQRYLMALVASVALIFLIIPICLGILLPESQIVVAYINVDINPSFELGINKKGNVVEVLGLNDDGEKILQNLELISIPIEEAMEILTTAAIQEKYLTSDKENTVLITVSSNEQLPRKVKNLENKVKRILQENNITAGADTIEVSEEIHKIAKEENISTGKYVLYMEAIEEGLDVSLDDLRGDSIINVVKEAGGVPGQLISKVKQDKDRIQEIHQKQEERKRKNQEDKNIKKDDNTDKAQSRERELEDKQQSEDPDDNEENEEQLQEAGKQKTDDLEERKDIDKWGNKLNEEEHKKGRQN